MVDEEGNEQFPPLPSSTSFKANTSTGNNTHNTGSSGGNSDTEGMRT